MTPKEKALDLIIKYRPLVKTWDCYWDTPIPQDEVDSDARKCALIAVDEILSVIQMYVGGLNPNWAYWSDVKGELSIETEPILPLTESENETTHVFKSTHNICITHPPTTKYHDSGYISNIDAYCNCGKQYKEHDVWKQWAIKNGYASVFDITN